MISAPCFSPKVMRLNNLKTETDLFVLYYYTYV